MHIFYLTIKIEKRKICPLLNIFWDILVRGQLAMLTQEDSTGDSSQNSPRWAGRGRSQPAARPGSAGCSASGSCPLSPWSSPRAHVWSPAASPSWWSPSGRRPGPSPGPAGPSPGAPPGCRPASESPGTSCDGLLVSAWSRTETKSLQTSSFSSVTTNVSPATLKRLLTQLRKKRKPQFCTPVLIFEERKVFVKLSWMSTTNCKTELFLLLSAAPCILPTNI